MRLRHLLWPLAGAAAWVALAGSPAAADDAPATPDAEVVDEQPAEVTPLDAWLAEQQAAHEQRQAERQERLDAIRQQIRQDLGLEEPAAPQPQPVDEQPSAPDPEPEPEQPTPAEPEPVDEGREPDAKPTDPADDYRDTLEQRWADRTERTEQAWADLATDPTPVRTAVGLTVGTVLEYTVVPIVETVTVDLLGPVLHPVATGLAPVTETLRPVLDTLGCILHPILAPLRPVLTPVVDALIVPLSPLQPALDPVLDVVTAPSGAVDAPWLPAPGQPAPEVPATPVPAPPVPAYPAVPVVPVDERPATPAPAPAPIAHADQLVPAAVAGTTAAADVDQAADTDPTAHPASEPGSSSTGAGGSHSGGSAADADTAGTLALRLTPGRWTRADDEHADGLTHSVTPRPA